MDQTLLNIIFSGGMAVLGWLGKTIWDANKELRADLSKLREELPIDYVRKEDIEKRCQMNLLSPLNSVPHDKLGHIVAGVLIYAVAHFVSPLFGLLMVALAAFGKELYDYLHRDKHSPDALDAVATLAGGLLAFISGV